MKKVYPIFTMDVAEPSDISHEWNPLTPNGDPREFEAEVIRTVSDALEHLGRDRPLMLIFGAIRLDELHDPSSSDGLSALDTTSAKALLFNGLSGCEVGTINFIRDALIRYLQAECEAGRMGVR